MAFYMEENHRDYSILRRLHRTIWNRENLWAFVLAFMILATITCATIEGQPQFVYGGF